MESQRTGQPVGRQNAASAPAAVWTGIDVLRLWLQLVVLGRGRTNRAPLFPHPLHAAERPTPRMPVRGGPPGEGGGEPPRGLPPLARPSHRCRAGPDEQPHRDEPADGEHGLAAVSTDQAGNSETSAALVVTIDTQMATPTIDLDAGSDSADNDDDVTSDNTPTLTGPAKPAHIVTPSVTSRGIVNLSAVAAVDAQAREIMAGMPESQPGAQLYFAGVYAHAAIPARYAVERRQWQEAARLRERRQQDALRNAAVLVRDARLRLRELTPGRVAAARRALREALREAGRLPAGGERDELELAIRSAFVAAEGTRLLSADYSQVELRILAHVSGEPALHDAFLRGDDIHAATAAEVLGKDQATLTKDERNRAKAVNFGIIYGISSFGLSENLEIPREQAQEYIDTYLARFPHVQDFIERTIEQAKRDGYVTTLLGRRRPVPEIRASNRQTRSLGERLAVNSVMQGTAADVIKVAMIRIHDRLREEGRSARLVLQVHDELLLEAPETEVSAVKELVREEMCTAYPLDPPLAVDAGAGDDWNAAKG